MGNFLHKRVHVGPDECVLVQISIAANVMLLSDANFAKYRSGRGGYEYYGGHYRSTPVHIRPPRSGDWNVVIDLGGRAGRIRTSVQIVPA